MDKWIYDFRYGFCSESSIQFRRKKYVYTNSNREKNKEGIVPHCQDSKPHDALKVLTQWTDDACESLREGQLKYQISIVLLVPRPRARQKKHRSDDCLIRTLKEFTAYWIGSATIFILLHWVWPKPCWIEGLLCILPNINKVMSYAQICFMTMVDKN